MSIFDGEFLNIVMSTFVENKLMAPLPIGDTVYIYDGSTSCSKKVVIENIIQDSSKAFNFEAKVVSESSEEEVFVYFKDTDIGVTVFKNPR